MDLKGTATLHLSQADMCQAIEFWMAQEFIKAESPEAIVVEKVEAQKDMGTDHFNIKFRVTPPGYAGE